MFTCLVCGREYLYQVAACPICNGICLPHKQPEMQQKADLYNGSNKKKKICVKTATQLYAEKLKFEDLPGFELFGKLPVRWHLLLSGPPGGGKSTFALMLANTLANIGKVLYWSYEEKFADTFVYKLQLNNINTDNIFFCDTDNFFKFLRICQQIKPHTVIIDSLNDANIETMEIKRIKQIGIAVGIYIAHFTKDGKYKGDSSIKHEIDIYVEIENKIATVKKNRVGIVGKTMAISIGKNDVGTTRTNTNSFVS